MHISIFLTKLISLSIRNRQITGPRKERFIVMGGQQSGVTKKFARLPVLLLLKSSYIISAVFI